MFPDRTPQVAQILQVRELHVARRAAAALRQQDVLLTDLLINAVAFPASIAT
jgi:hypothetical protein